jgi:hypothetical protein
MTEINPGVTMFGKWSKSYFYLFISILISFVPYEFSVAQDQDVDITVTPTSILEDSQILSISGLGIDTDGSGAVLVSLTIDNLSDQRAENLFLEIIISAGKVGTILEYTQESHRPFSLRPFQSVYITNNDVANEVFPGINETISFEGGLTPEGEDLIGDISGSTSLPRDTYTLEVNIFTVSDANGKTILASDVANIGGSSVGVGEEGSSETTIEESEVILRTPGDVVGVSAQITNPYPQFSWEGESTARYRLLVVEDNNQESPESLIQSAKSSAPISEAGSLLEYENLDTYVQGTSFQFPSSGVQPLESGKTYYWQVITTVRTSGDQKEILSEIWNFTLNDQSETSSPSSDPQISEDIERALVELIGQESFNELEERGYSLESIEYDGQQFSGTSAAILLEELLQKIRDEEIILQEN